MGPLCVVLAAVLEWWASPATLSLTRTSSGEVSVTMVSKLFNRLPTTITRYDGVRSVEYVPSTIRRRDGSFRGGELGSDRLVFHTATETIDRTRAQQLFRPDFPEIKSFFADTSAQTLSISSLARVREWWRFVAAQAAVVFLVLLGAGVMFLGIKEVRHRNRDVLIRGVDY
jgi:hypothetical protein